MVWMGMSTIVLLQGAELDAEVAHQTAGDSTEGRSKPIGRRGAHVADAVGEAKT